MGRFSNHRCNKGGHRSVNVHNKDIIEEKIKDNETCLDESGYGDSNESKDSGEASSEVEQSPAASLVEAMIDPEESTSSTPK